MRRLEAIQIKYLETLDADGLTILGGLSRAWVSKPPIKQLSAFAARTS